MHSFIISNTGKGIINALNVNNIQLIGIDSIGSLDKLSVIDGFIVSKNTTYTDKQNWEVGDTFNGFIGTNRYVSGIVIGLPFDIDDNTKVSLAIDNLI